MMATRKQDGNWSEFLTTDPGEAEGYLAGVYGAPVRLRLGGFPYRFWHRRLSAGALHADTIDHTAAAEAVTDTVPGVVPVIRAMRGKRTDLNRDLTIGPGGTIVAAEPGTAQRSWNENFRYSLISLPLDAVGAVAVNRPDDEPVPLRFGSLLPVTPGAGRRWTGTVRYVTAELRDYPETAVRPLASDALTRLLALALLDTFPGSWSDLPPEYADQTDAIPPVLARAISFIESNAGLPVTMADVARAARVTVRAVQLAFRRHADTTPGAYLRLVRLERAREELKAASPLDGITVAGTAGRWGWSSPDRFAAAYRARFGEPPSQTLRG
jgi:AraC-like DNA-binding protein